MTTKASGTGSLKFTVPVNSSGALAGTFFTNFSKDLSAQFGANSEFYIQWRQRLSPEFLTTLAHDFKQAIIGTGDKPGCTSRATATGFCYASCTALEIVTQRCHGHGFGNGFPILYNSCTGSASHGAYDPFYQPFGAYDFKLQNARSPRVGGEFANSHVDMWVAREGQPSEQVIDWGPYNLTAGPPAEDQRYGRIWLLPYYEGADVHPAVSTWYDELIISRERIPDSAAAGSTPAIKQPQ